jgi:hypothetical protein
MVKRIYIYRCGTTSDCALTGAKDDPRLPAPVTPHRWRLWMQIGPLQPEHRSYGFNLWTAVKEIGASGYHLFTGSETLLSKRPLAPSKALVQDKQADA